MIAVAYVVYQVVHRPPAKEWLKVVLLATAFVFWAANKCWRDPRAAMIFNNIAIALFRARCLPGDDWLAGGFAG